MTELDTEVSFTITTTQTKVDKPMFINTPAENESLEDVYYGKKEIMKIFHCENDKALRILRFLFYKN